MRKWFVRAGITLLAVFVAAGLIYNLALRSWCLRWGTTPAEAHATLPGDDLFPVYAGEATHAITIHAPPEQVWPWLMQIGQDRSGFYSYTFLEKFGRMRNAQGGTSRAGMEAASGGRDRLVRYAQAIWRAGPHDRCGGAATALVRDGQRERLGKAASGKTGSGRFLELHAGTFGRPAKPPDCAPAWRNAAVAGVARGRQTVLGADALHHGAEDAAHNQRLVAA